MTEVRHGSGKDNAIDIASVLYRMMSNNIADSAKLNVGREAEMTRTMALVWYGALLGMAGTAAMIAQGENNHAAIKACVDEMALVASKHFSVLSATGESFIIDKRGQN